MRRLRWCYVERSRSVSTGVFSSSETETITDCLVVFFFFQAEDGIRDRDG